MKKSEFCLNLKGDKLLLFNRGSLIYWKFLVFDFLHKVRRLSLSTSYSSRRNPFLRWSRDLLLKWCLEIFRNASSSSVYAKFECFLAENVSAPRHRVALFTFTHLSEDFNGWNCSKRAEYVTDISLSPEFRAYIFPRNYSCIRQRYAIIKLNGRERRANAKSVDAISQKKKKNRINAR